MKRRSFLQGLGLAGGVAAVETVKASTSLGSMFTANVPAKVVEQVAVNGEAHFQLQLIERVESRRQAIKETWATQPIILRGNVDAPNPNEDLVGDKVLFDVSRYCTVEGVRIFGGKLAGGRPWNNFAWFAAAPTLVAGNVLTVSYTLTIGQGDPMSAENRDRPLRELVDGWENER